MNNQNEAAEAEVQEYAQANWLTRLIADALKAHDPHEFTPDRMIWLLQIIDPIVTGQSAGDYSQLAHDAKDFAGGTTFCTQDIAQALYHPSQDDEPSEEEIAQVTEHQRQQAIKTIESYIFNGSYTWIEALRDNLDDVPPDQEDEEEDARCEFCGDMRGDREGTLCADCLEKVEEHENDGHEKYEDVTCPACRGVA